MQRYAVVVALLIWAIPVVIVGVYLTNVEYTSWTERITVAAIFGIGSLVGAITISIAAWVWSSTYDFAGRRADLTGVVTTVKSGSITRGLLFFWLAVATVIIWVIWSSVRDPGTGGYDPFGPDRDCGDFSSHRQAQNFYEAAGGPGSDRHRLDADRDGIACEALR